MNPVAALGGGFGLQASFRAFDRAASAVSASTTPASPESAIPASSSADLVDGMVGMDLAATAVKAQVAVLRTADEMLGTLLDLRA